MHSCLFTTRGLSLATSLLLSKEFAPVTMDVSLTLQAEIIQFHKLPTPGKASQCSGASVDATASFLDVLSTDPASLIFCIASAMSFFSFLPFTIPWHISNFQILCQESPSPPVPPASYSEFLICPTNLFISSNKPEYGCITNFTMLSSSSIPTRLVIATCTKQTQHKQRH